MVKAGLIIAAIFFGVSWVVGAPYPQGEGWRVFLGWILIAWAIFNVKDLVQGSRGFAKLFLFLLIVAVGMGAVNGNWTLWSVLF